MFAVNVIGRLSRDIENRSTKNGVDVVGFGVASSSYSGKDKEDTIWWNCSIWPEDAKKLSGRIKCLKKGSLVYLDASVQDVRGFQGKDGNNSHAIDINVVNIRFINSAKSSDSVDSGIEDNDNQEDQF